METNREMNKNIRKNRFRKNKKYQKKIFLIFFVYLGPDPKIQNKTKLNNELGSICYLLSLDLNLKLERITAL
jgi:hypothetical protein